MTESLVSRVSEWLDSTECGKVAETHEMLNKVWTAAEDGTFKHNPWLSASDDDETAKGWAESIRRYEHVMTNCVAWHRVAASLTPPLADCGEKLAELATRVEKRVKELDEFKSKHGTMKEYLAVVALSRVLLQSPKPSNFENDLSDVASWITKKLGLSFYHDRR